MVIFSRTRDAIYGIIWGNKGGPAVKVSFVMYGVPHGFDCMDCTPQQLRFFENMYRPGTGIQKRANALVNGDVVYSYLMYPDKNAPFLDCDWRGGAFLGMSIVLPGMYLRDTEKLDKFFQEFYKKYIDNQIVSTRPNGVRQFRVSRLGTPQMEKYITNALNKFVRERPDLNFTESAAPYVQRRSNSR